MTEALDIGAFLGETITELEDLPPEVCKYLEEIQANDKKIEELRELKERERKEIILYNQKNGYKERNLMEDVLSHRIKEHIETMKKLNDESLELIKKTLDLVNNQVNKLEKGLKECKKDSNIEGDKTPDSQHLAIEKRTPRSQKKKHTKLFEKMVRSRSHSRTRKIGTESGTDDRHEEGNESEGPVYCICQQSSYGEMVGCDNPNCKFEWFHYECVGILEPPKGTWYCVDCLNSKNIN